MLTNMIKNKLAGSLLALSLFGMTTMTACLKTENSSTQTVWAYSTVINASPDSAGVDVYDGAKKLTTSKFTFRAWTILRDVPGVHSYAFYNYGTNNLAATVPSINYDSTSYHTIILYSNNPKRVAQFSESFTGTSSDSANLRFFHLSDSIAPVDVYINNKLIFAGRSYTPTSGFISTWTLIPGSTNASVQVKLHSNDSLLVNRVISFNSANAYQLFLNGNPHPKDTSTGLSLNVAQYATY